MSPKILIISTHIAPEKGFGGPSVSIRRFIDILRGRNIPYLAISSGSKTKTYEHNDSIEFVYKYIGSGRNGFTLKLLNRLLLEISKTNWILINGITTWPNFLGIFFGGILGKKIILFPRGGLESGRIDDWNILKKSVFKFQCFFLKIGIYRDNTLIVSATESEYNKNIIRSSKDLILPNIILRKFKPTTQRSIDILFVGRFSREKGIDRLDDLLLSKSEKFSIVLVLAGTDILTRAGLKKRYGHIKRLTILYDMDYEELDKIYQNSKLLFFPSYKENFGNVLIEAVNNGVLPIVFNDTHWSFLSSDFGLNVENLDKILSSTETERSNLYESAYDSIEKRYYKHTSESLKYVLQLIS